MGARIKDIANEVVTPAAGDYLVVDQVGAGLQTGKIRYDNLTAATTAGVLAGLSVGGMSGHAVGQTSLTSGQATGNVTFAGGALPAVPAVVATVQAPSGSGYVIIPTVYNVTTTGFSYALSAPPPDGNYKLNWVALKL